MDATTINQQLRDVYQPYLDHLHEQDWSKYPKVSSPLLMHVFDDYVAMLRKVMIVGQETHSWAGEMNQQHDLPHILRVYEGFKLGQHFAKQGKRTRILTSPFWNFSRSIFHGLNSDMSRQTPGFLWTNISKFDDGGTTPNQELQHKNERGFHLLREEIRITKPDVVIFLTGTKYDCWIAKVFNLIELPEPVLDGLLWRIHTNNDILPLMFKTQHPRTLCAQKLYRPVSDKLLEVAAIN